MNGTRAVHGMYAVEHRTRRAREPDAIPAIDAIGAWQARDARRSFRGIAAFSRACFALLGAMADRLGIA
jgi:hypothetical protein